MSPTDPAARLALLAGRPDGEIDLAAGALLVAAAMQPGLDPDAEAERLARLGAEAAARIDGPPPAAGGERLRRLTAFLYREQGFAGDAETYCHPDNSLLNRVLDRRRGIPLSLALVLIEVGRRVGVPLVGIGFPGHFLVRHAHHPELVLDPFEGGRPLTRGECAELLARVAGGGAEFHPRLLQPSPRRDILLRLLNNLHAAHLRRGEAASALTALDLALVLVPGDPARLRARGMLRLRTCDFAGAAADLDRYLAACPDAPDRGALGELIECARRRLRRLH
jgi:regulator of sirC expression with transglutaminase-like and TPR domain